MLHKIKFQIIFTTLYKREQKTPKNQKNKTNKRRKNKKQKKRSKPLIAALEEVVKFSGIIFESYQRGSSV